MITYSVQLAHFKPDRVEDRGRVTKDEAIKALSHFPFTEELRKLIDGGEGCLPTITFRDAGDQSILTFWIDESNTYTIEGQLGKHRFSAEQFTSSRDTLLQILVFFIEKNLEGISQLLGDKQSRFHLSPKLFPVLFVEVPIICLTFLTYNMGLGIANLFFDNPNVIERFFYQLIFLHIVVAILLWLFGTWKR